MSESDEEKALNFFVLHSFESWHYIYYRHTKILPQL